MVNKPRSIQSISMWSIDLFGPTACKRRGQDGRQYNNTDTHSLSFSNQKHDDAAAHVRWTVSSDRCAESEPAKIYTLNINRGVILRWLSSYLEQVSLHAFALNPVLPSKQMKWALPNRELKIRTISCHRRIRHRSNARATTPSAAYMWADVALLKLHCRPNDLDCWVEALAGSQSLYCL